MSGLARCGAAAWSVPSRTRPPRGRSGAAGRSWPCGRSRGARASWRTRRSRRWSRRPSPAGALEGLPDHRGREDGHLDVGDRRDAVALVDQSHGRGAGTISSRPSRSAISRTCPAVSPRASRRALGTTMRPAPSMAVLMPIIYHPGRRPAVVPALGESSLSECARFAVTSPQAGSAPARELHPGAVTRPCRSETAQTLTGILAPGLAPIADPQCKSGWSEVCVLVTRCSKGSGSQQIVKYRSYLQELACLDGRSRQRRHGDVIGFRANIGLDLENSEVRPAGFEPATRCLEGSRSIRLSYGRSLTIVHGEGHATATRRSQSARRRT